ncbi:hypothetical protein, partial [Vibrio vulnificus]|uniref:hypothetical protein n=1 Tax=Vibrio vulnificus TaxID=672 RepID=UPI003EDA46FA
STRIFKIKNFQIEQDLTLKQPYLLAKKKNRVTGGHSGKRWVCKNIPTKKYNHLAQPIAPLNRGSAVQS